MPTNRQEKPRRSGTVGADTGYLQSYAREMAWREDTRREPNGILYLLVASAALAHPVSREWKGYWQKRANP